MGNREKRTKNNGSNQWQPQQRIALGISKAKRQLGTTRTYTDILNKYISTPSYSHYSVMPIENSMKRPDHFLGCPGILNFSMGLIIALYAIIGFFGYVKYGEATQGSVTLNLPIADGVAQTVKILIALAILFTYGLQMFVPTVIVWNWLEPIVPEKKKLMIESVYRITAVFISVGVAAAVPNLGPIISLVGAVCFSTLGLLWPAVIDTVTRWEEGATWRRYKNIAIAGFAIMALVAGSYSSMLEIIQVYG